MDQQILAANDASRARLLALLARATDAELATPLPDGWTVGAALAHLAFFDRRTALLIERWERAGITPSELDVDVVNDASKPVWLALPPRAVVAEVRAAAEEGDAAVARLSPELWQAIAEGNLLRLNRGKHRAEHLDEIEAALAGS